MTSTDIYTGPENGKTAYSMRYISITVNHVTGILNRVMSLMRRKRYNMEEVSVTFDRARDQADIILALDARLNDVNHVIQQIRKLHDVYEVNDITMTADKIFHVFDVSLADRNADEKFPRMPEKTVHTEGREKQVFMVPLADVPAFSDFLKIGGYEYGERVISLA